MPLLFLLLFEYIKEPKTWQMSTRCLENYTEVFLHNCNRLAFSINNQNILLIKTRWQGRDLRLLCFSLGLFRYCGRITRYHFLSVTSTEIFVWRLGCWYSKVVGTNLSNKEPISCSCDNVYFELFFFPSVFLAWSPLHQISDKIKIFNANFLEVSSERSLAGIINRQKTLLRYNCSSTMIETTEKYLWKSLLLVKL